MDDRALPVVHGDDVGGQLIEPRVEPARKQRESAAVATITPIPSD